MTFNNLGVYYKMLQKHNQAIKYLKQVLSIEQEMLEINPEIDVTEVCQTNVNICTIYSEMGKHEIALKYVEEAVRILDREYEGRVKEGFGGDG
jgi:tetratricopeptide (TPR) repeat protein